MQTANPSENYFTYKNLLVMWGYDMGLCSFAKSFLKQYPNSKFIICGDGSPKHYIYKLDSWMNISTVRRIFPDTNEKDSVFLPQISEYISLLIKQIQPSSKIANACNFKMIFYGADFGVPEFESVLGEPFYTTLKSLRFIFQFDEFYNLRKSFELRISY